MDVRVMWNVLGMAGVVGVLALAGSASAGKPSGGGGGSINTQGTLIVCDGTSSATRGTYRMNPDGTGLTRISNDIYANDVTKGHAVMTVLMNVNPGVDIQALRADGAGGLVPLVTSPEGESTLRFSQDGARIAYRAYITGHPTPYQVRTADVLRDGSGNVTSVANIQTVWMGAAQLWTIDWSRDGTKIVMSINNAGAPDLYVLHLSDSTLEQLTNTPEREEGPRWSPSDDRVAYLKRADGATGIASLMTIDYGTRAEVTVLAGQSNKFVNTTSSWPAWSPGATHLLAVVSGYKKPTDVYQFPSGGGSGTNLTSATTQTFTLPNWGW